MSLFSYFKRDEEESKVHDSQYIRTANEADKADTKPAEPTSPKLPEAK